MLGTVGAALRRLKSLHSPRLGRGTILGLFACSCVGALQAQVRPTLLENVTILRSSGEELADATVAYQGGKFLGVGTRVPAPFFAKKVDGKNQFVTAGLIDVWSTVGLQAAPGEGAAAAARAADAVNLFDAFELERAWSRGIIAAYVPAPASGGVGGVGTVMKYVLGGDPEKAVLQNEAALCWAIGADDEPALRRVQQLQQFRDAFQEALDYRLAREDYEEDLKEYEEKLAERAKKAGDPQDDAKPADAGADAKRAAAGTQKGARKPGKKTPGDKDEPKPASRKRGSGANKKPPNSGEAAKGDDKDAEAKKDELKKPQEPPRDPNKDVLIRALNGEIPVRVAVDRPEDIAGVVAIAEDYGLRLIIEGGGGAHLIAKSLAKSKVPVVIGAARPDMLFHGGSRRYDVGDAAAKLAGAGVSVYLASGSSGGDLPLAAAALIGAGLDPAHVWGRLTREAGEFLGVKDLGVLKPGESADFVVWSGHPLAPESRVERVIINGEEVYNAAKAGGRS